MLPPIHLSTRSHQTADQPISYFMQQAVENPRLISLAAGLVDAESLPAADVQAALADILSSPAHARAALQYGTTHGLAPLREQLLLRTVGLDGLTPAALSLSADDVVITTGSQQLLYLMGELLLDPGDIGIAEAPSYFVYQGTLTSLGARVLSVPMDEEGMDIDALASLLARLERTGEVKRLRMLYICDYFQNPTGRTLSVRRRRQLLDLVKNYSRTQRILILEDAAYRELRYDGPDLPSLKSLDADNSTVILGMTFSKPLAPGLKTGYAILPRDLMTPLLRLKGCHDFGSNNLTQHLIQRLLADGSYDRHVAELCQVYRAKRDAMLEALSEEFDASEVKWTHPDGGMYVWLAFAGGVNTGPDSTLMRAALHEGVLYVPGQFCHVNGANGPVPTHEARLCFGVASVPEIREAIQRLGRAYRSSQAGSRKLPVLTS